MASAADAPRNQGPRPCQLANDDYTVGWICALTTEYVAAQVFLDEEHMPPTFTAPHDNNDYTLGRIGKHNVAIAVLPGGEYGTASAAGVARDMLHTFPNIRIGLMVGIGGGAPTSKHDIRLGDVVVSEPKTRLGGVFQYDFGKNIQDQPFQSTRFLAPPPPVLLTAVSGLRAEYEIDGHTIRENIEACLVARKRLRKNYSHPDAATDRLYQSSVVHPVSEASCASCGSDASSVIIRPVRDEDGDDPTIHYGLIASANQLMKDAKLRDQYANERGILCFEMEAGGLMNHFPCLIIRGICDYSDTHKNKAWQGYAAMAAAAYAKDLLKRILPNKVEAEKKLIELVENVAEDVRTTCEAVSRIESTVVKDKVNEILNWLTPTPIDYGSQYSSFLKVRQPGTGQWFLDTAQYQSWVSKQKQTLFCPGIPGAGKTILASIIIEDLFSRFEGIKDVGIAYLYCNLQSQKDQTVDNLLASLLRQLVQSRPSLSKEVKSLCDKHKDKQTRPSVDEITNALQRVTRLYSTVFIVVDALDECEGEYRPAFLSHLFALQTTTPTNILATSRPIQKIEKEFEWRCDIIKISARDEDVERFLNNAMKKLQLLGAGLPDEIKEDLRNKIRTTIVEAVHGMFLLASLHLESLVDKTTESGLCTALESLPKGQNALAKAYGITIARIRSQLPGFRFLAERVLTLLTCAERPLTTLELQDALAVTDGAPRLDKTKREHTSIIVSVCAGLVTVDADSGIIRLVHETTREYLASHMHCIRPQEALTTIENPMELNEEKNIIAMAEAHRTLAITCVTYLSFSDFDSGFCETDAAFEERLKTNQFYDYAAQNWGSHARGASCIQQVHDFLKNSNLVEAASQALLATQLWPGRSDYSQRVSPRMTGLHLAAYFGIDTAVGALLQCDVDADARDATGRAPLAWAAARGHGLVVELLLGRSARITADTDSMTALHYTVSRSSEEMALYFLKTGVSIDTGVKRRSLLEAGADNEARRALLNSNDAVVDCSTGRHRGLTALHYACLIGSKKMTEFLLQNRANPNAASEFGETPLHLALKRDLSGATPWLGFSDRWSDSTYSVEYILEILQEEDPKGEDDTEYRRTASIIEEYRASVLTSLLGDERTDVAARDDDGATALHSVMYGSSTSPDIVKRLVERGADISARNNRGQTPLHLACLKSDVPAVATLLDHGADVGAVDDMGVNCFHYAAQSRHTKAVLPLLTAASTSHVGALPLAMSRDLRGRNALHHLFTGRKHVDGPAVQSLLDLGVKCDELDKNGMSPLACYLSVVQGSINADEVIQLLFQGGSDATFKTRADGLTLAHMHAKSAMQVRVEILRVLARFEVDLQVTDNQSRSVLHHCAIRGSLTKQVVFFLRDEVGLLLMDKDVHGKTAVDYAAAAKQQWRHPDTYDRGRWSRTEEILLSMI
ncbi:hypothetical protein NLG97_g2707 [Lecanicillium saksenae]|uniref:Uncharacterized protein n=1 Tax=Lecanicillium saksenae TaxID=468837 RepID=A0ACC1R051_9HYPO|nr:hypothetical protein NLG97_g2707 [Lecanicillium saksenae]